MRSGPPRSLVLFALLGGVVAFIVAALGSTLTGLVAGLVCFVVAMAFVAWRTRPRGAHDPSRRRFLTARGARRAGVALRGRRARPRDPQALLPRPTADPAGHGARHGRRVHGARATGVPPRSIGRPATPARPVQQRELLERVREARALLPQHQPRIGVDVSGAGAARGLRPRTCRALGQHRTRDARRHRAHHRSADRVRRVAHGSGRDHAPLDPAGVHAPEDRGDVRDRRRRMERPEAVARPMAQPQTSDAGAARTTATPSSARSPPSPRALTRRSAPAPTPPSTASRVTTSATAARSARSTAKRAGRTPATS